MSGKFGGIFKERQKRGAKGTAKREAVQNGEAGKRANPDYRQVSAYLRKETHDDVKKALIGDKRERDFSDLVQELLEKWLKAE